MFDPPSSGVSTSPKTSPSRSSSDPYPEMPDPDDPEPELPDPEESESELPEPEESEPEVSLPDDPEPELSEPGPELLEPLADRSPLPGPLLELPDASPGPLLPLPSPERSSAPCSSSPS